MRIKSALFVLLLPVLSFGQDTIVRNFSANITFSGMSLHSAGKYQGTILVNDQTGKYKASDVMVNDLVYTNSANSYVVDSILSLTFTSASVRLRQTGGTASAPIGTGYISRPSKEFGLPFLAPYNQSGISSQLQAVAISNLVYKIDSLMKSSSGVNVDTIQLNGEIVGGLYNTMLDTVNRVRFNTTYNPSADTVGYLRWDSANGTLSLGLLGGNVVLQIGQEEVHRVRNDAGVGLVDGDIVYISGSQGDRPKVKKADADAEISSSVTFGVATESIANGQDGFVTVSGYVRGVNTNGLVEGGAIWLDTIPGKFTQVKPQAPVHSVLVGYVIRALNNGTIFVKIQNGYELDELHNVSITSPRNGSIISYDSLTGIWKDTLAANVFGSVSDKIIPVGTATGQLTNSTLADSSGVLYINRNGLINSSVNGNSILFDTRNADGSNVRSIPYDTVNKIWDYRGIIDWRSTKVDNTQRNFARIAAFDIDSTGNNRYGKIEIGTGHNGTSFGGSQVIVSSYTQNRKQVFLGDGYVNGLIGKDTAFQSAMVTVTGTPSHYRDAFRVQNAGDGNKILFSVYKPTGETRINGKTRISTLGENYPAFPSYPLDVIGYEQQIAAFRRNSDSQANIVIGNNGFTPSGNNVLASIRVTSPYISKTDSLVKQSIGLMAFRVDKVKGWIDTTTYDTDQSVLRYSTRLLTRNVDNGYGVFSVYPTGTDGSIAIAQRMNVVNGGDARSPIFGDTVSLGVSGLAYFSDRIRIGGSPLAYTGLSTDINNSQLFIKQSGFANTTFMRENGASGITLTSINGTAASPTNVNSRFGVINTQYYHTGSFRQAIPIEFYADSLSTGFKTGIIFKNDADNGVMSIRNGKVLIGGSDYSDLSLKISATDAIKIPSGTTAQRPNLTHAGMVRYNSDSTLAEYYNGSKWIQMQPSIKTSTELQVTGDTLISLAQQGALVGEVMKWSGTAWVPGVDNGGSSVADLTFSGTSSPITLNSSLGTDVTFTAGSGIGMTASSSNINISVIPTGDWTGTFDGQDGTYYLSRSNHTGLTPVSGGGTGLTTLGTANQLLRVNSGGTALEYFTPGYLSSEVDGSVSNEGSLTVGAGTASTSVISSNTAGSTPVTLQAGTNISLSELNNTITIDAASQALSFTPESANLTISDGNSVSIGFGGLTAGGTYANNDLMHLYDVSGSDYESITLGDLGTVLANYTSIKAMADVDDGTPTTGQILKWDGDSWAFSSDLTGTGGMSSWNWGLSGNTSSITDGSTVTLSAGSGISLSKTGNDISITNTTANSNIYNTNASLTSDRTVNLNGYYLQFTGNSSKFKTTSSGNLYVESNANSFQYSNISSNSIWLVAADQYINFNINGNNAPSPAITAYHSSAYSGIDFKSGALDIFTNTNYLSGPSMSVTTNGFLKLYYFPSTTPTAISTLDANNQIGKMIAGKHVSIGSNLNVVPAAVTSTSPANGSTLIPDHSSFASQVRNINVTGLTSLTIAAPINTLNGGVYTYHFRGVGSLGVTWDTVFKDASGTSMGTKTYTSSQFITCYFDGTNNVYYCQ